MAFERANWVRQTLGMNSGKVGDENGPAMFTYQSGTDNAAAIAAADYFADAVFDLAVGDIIMSNASDAFTARRVATIDRVAGTITTEGIGLNDAIDTGNIVNDAVTADKLADDAVETDKILDGAVTLAKLASAIAPSHVVKFAAQATTGGGDAAEEITVTGAVDTDLAFVQMVDNGTNSVTIVDAVVTADTLTVTFSGDPGDDAVVNYQLLRATA